RSDLPPFVPSYEGRANANFFLINRLCAFDSLFCASKSDNPFAFILFRTLLHKRISQLFCNQFVPHSLSKTPGVGTPILPLPLCVLRSACGACPDLIGVISVVKSSPALSHVSRHSSLASFLLFRSVERPFFFNEKSSLSLFS